MTDTRLHRAPATALDPSDLVGFLDDVAPHEVRVLIGPDPAILQERLALEPPRARPVIRLDLDEASSVADVVEAATAQLAQAVAHLWPYLWGGEDFSELRDDALGHAHLPIRLAALAARQPRLSQNWARDAVRRMLHGRPPRVPAAAPALEWAQLVHAFSPAGLTIVTPLCDAHGEGFSRALEWLAAHADVAVIVLAAHEPDEAAFERILYGARRMAVVPECFTPPCGDAGDRRSLPLEPETPAVLALPTTEGRPHPQSAAELRLYTLLQADADLQPLFAFNKFVPGLPLLQAKADLIWCEGRVVVEIDGHEHRGHAKFRADRHRDYELMWAGYRVLRMTNDDIATDAPLAIEKIRTVVRLARREGR